MADARAHLAAVLRATVDGLAAYYDLTPLKTVAYYQRALRQAIRDLYASGDVGPFVDKLVYLIDEQFRRAWNEGARDVGFPPERMSDSDRLRYMFRADAEKEHVLGLAQAILDARENDTPVDRLLARAEMWATRYNEVRDQARAYFGGLERLVWRVGPTEHCETCLLLNGVVATAVEWNAARMRGYYPKSPKLACGGFRCQCELSPTDDPVSLSGIPV